jgi:hypothetical protein
MSKLIELRSRPDHIVMIEASKILGIDLVRSHGEIRLTIHYMGGTKRTLGEPHASEFLEQWQRWRRSWKPFSFLYKILLKR